MYAGFRFAGALPSIKNQRLIQRTILERLLALGKFNRGVAFLSLGVGDGQELNVLFQSSFMKEATNQLICVDISDNYFNLQTLPNLRGFGCDLKFIKNDVRNLHDRFDSGKFDIIHLSFLLHEIMYEEKDRVLLQISEVLKPNGYVLYSDIFLDNRKKIDRQRDILRMSMVRLFYEKLIEEAHRCRANGSLTKAELSLLCGDGSTDGFLRSMMRAIEGVDDYYESLADAKRRLRRVALSELSIHPNRKNEYLFTIVARRHGYDK